MVKITNPKTRRILMITLIILGVTPIVTILYLTYQMRTALSEADQALQENGKLYNRLKASMGTKPEIPAHKLGDRIELGNQAITVYGFEPYSEPGMKRRYGVSKGVAMDILVENTMVVEIKAVDAITPVHLAQLITFLKLSGKYVGLLMNFNVVHLRDGIRRMVQGEPASVSSVSSVVKSLVST